MLQESNTTWPTPEGLITQTYKRSPTDSSTTAHVNKGYQTGARVFIEKVVLGFFFS